MFNFHLNDLMYLVWMLDFYERVPLTKVARPKNEPGGLLADLAPQYSDKLAEPDKAKAYEIVDQVKKVAATINLPTSLHRTEVFSLHLRHNITRDEYIKSDQSA